MNITELFKWFVTNEVNNRQFNKVYKDLVKYHHDKLEAEFKVSEEIVCKNYMSNYKVQTRKLAALKSLKNKEYSIIMNNLRNLKEIYSRLSKRFNNDTVIKASDFLCEYIEKNIIVKN